MTEAVATPQDEEPVEVPITVTEEAGEKLVAEMAKADKPVDAIRLIVQQGGCCGLQYAMSFAQGEPNEIEEAFESGGVTFYIDAPALQAVHGATISWVEGPMGSGFHVDNPNLEGEACGC